MERFVRKLDRTVEVSVRQNVFRLSLLDAKDSFATKKESMMKAPLHRKEALRGAVSVDGIVSYAGTPLESGGRLVPNCILLVSYCIIISYAVMISQISRGDSSMLFDRNNYCLRSRTAGMSVEELWSKLPMAINHCTQRRFLRITGYRNYDEVKVHVIPSHNAFNDTSSCSIVSLGIGRDVLAETKMKADMPTCSFFGADPIKDLNQELYEKIGQFYNIAVGGENGTLKATVLEPTGGYRVHEVEYLDITTFLRNFIRKSLIDQLMIDIEWAEYGLLPYFLKSGDLENTNIVICQLNIEIHSPDYAQKVRFFEFFLQLMNDNRFAPLAVNAVLGHIRLYLLNHEHQECRRRYIAVQSVPQT